jgi:TP901 family phage tail tape measure protein
LGDVLNKLADEYATSVGELANGMTILSPIAGSLGFSMDEMAGFLIPVIEIFRSGSESATGMKTSLLSLSDPTKEVQKEFKKIGVELKDSSGKMKDVKTILADLMPVYSKMSKEQQLMTASMIAGKDQAAKFTALLNGMGTAAKATAIALNEGKDGLGSLNKEVDRGLGTTAVQIQRMEAAFDNLAIAIGTKYKDSWKEAIMGTTEIELALKKLADSGAFDEIFKAFNEFSGEIGRVFKEIAANLPEALANVDFS